MTLMMENDPKWFERSHHRVRRDPIGVSSPPLLLDSGVVNEMSAQEPAVRPHPLNGPTMNMAPLSPPAGAVVVAASPLEEDARPLLEEEVEEVMEEKPLHSDSSADSAFHSASTVEAIPPTREVLDKPRLSNHIRSDAIDLHDEMAVIIEAPCKKHQPTSSNDSGMVSDLASGPLST
ncbi:hypothetical protein GCK32_012805 [Trichostrongylus colubriformis]|uniref:Uncharacterized protein n=1 Tax=Trichostrongylus colubriformis TaxID=6319 RepID=A0AAN8GAZ7_TRICO